MTLYKSQLDSSNRVYGYKLGVATLVVLVTTVMMASSYMISQNVENKQIQVISKERLMKLSKDSEGNTRTSYQNLIYTEDETYIVEDSIWHWHFRSGTIYAKLKENTACDVKLVGYRWGFLSMYQNIIEADCT
jgi:hypothetical protein